MNNDEKFKKIKPVYEQFRFLYQQQGNLSAADLVSIYASSVVFKDPVHTINGLGELTEYFAGLGQNMNTCRFEFVDEMVGFEQAHITWNMRYSHQKIAAGKEQVLRGMTLIKFSNNRIIYHEDCYDIGAMVYEHLPVLGRMTKWVKHRMAG